MEPEYARQYVELYYRILDNRAKGGNVGEPQLTPELERVMPQMVRTRGGERLPNGLTTPWGDLDTFRWEYRADGVAIIDWQGPVVKRGGWLSAYSSMASISALMQSVRETQEHPMVKAVGVYMDTGGGTAAGLPELSEFVYSLRSGGKPMGVYTDSMIASAGLYVASAFESITVAENADLGSVGCVYVAVDYSDALKKEGIRKIVIHNSQSPLKYADIATKEGASMYQRLADQGGLLFAQALSKYRGQSVEYIWENFGKGGILMGIDAVSVGMVDALGDEESFLDQLAARGRGKKQFARSGGNTQKGATHNMNPKIAGALATLTSAFSAGDDNGGNQEPPVVPPVAAVPDAVQLELQQLREQVQTLTSQASSSDQSAAIQAALAASRLRESQNATLEAGITALPPACHDAGRALAASVLDNTATFEQLSAFLSAIPSTFIAENVVTPPAGADAQAAAAAARTSAVPRPEDQTEDPGAEDSAYIEARRAARQARVSGAVNAAGGASGTYVGG